MDHAALTDNNGKTADFRNVILIMTSNAGAREMVCNTIGFGGDGAKDPAEKGKKAVEEFFSPEFRNRLDDIITFKSLNLKIMEQVVDKFIAELQPQLSHKKVTLKLSGSARLWLAKNGYDPHFGARPLDRLIQKEIKDVLTDEILFRRLVKGGEVHVKVKDDKLVFYLFINMLCRFFACPKKLSFPPPQFAEPEGLLAVGGDLSEKRLLLAYRMGIFPWFSSGRPHPVVVS